MASGQQPTERSALLGSSRAPPPSLLERTRRLSQRHRRALLTAVAVAAAVTALLMAFLVFRYGSEAPVMLAVDGNGGAAATAGESEEYDAIVVGGGPAGSVLSKLLSDDKWRRVLLIEAGDTSQVDLGGKSPVESPLNVQQLTPFDVPYYWTSVANTPSLHWDYPGVNIAKALGGCGIHNAMLYVRALPRDLERWAMANWTWDKALQIYLQLEDYDGAKSSFHGTGGVVRTSVAGVHDTLSEQFVQACEQIGLPRTADFNAPSGRFGVGYYHFNTRDGVRESAARTFLGPLLQGQNQSQRANFRVLLNTLVSKVVINDADETEGVEVVRSDGVQETIRLSKSGQVIITAGAINTPKVLMMSGIGDASVLKDLNITVKKHLSRVGMNLQDHPVLGVTFESPNLLALDLQAELELYFKARENKAKNVSSYGLMGSSGISAGAFLIPPGSTIPEIQLTFFPRKSEPHITGSSDLNHTVEILITVALLTPKARNRVILVPRSNHGDVELIPRIASEVPGDTQEEHLRGDDVWKLSWGVGVVREIASVLAKKGLVGKELAPGADIASTEDLNTWVHSAVFRNSHWVGSASMAGSENEGVVDNRLRVFGVKGLRVADASIIPSIPNGNVHSSVLMIASHAAELIKADDYPIIQHSSSNDK